MVIHHLSNFPILYLALKLCLLSKSLLLRTRGEGGSHSSDDAYWHSPTQLSFAISHGTFLPQSAELSSHENLILANLKAMRNEICFSQATVYDPKEKSLHLRGSSGCHFKKRCIRSLSSHDYHVQQMISSYCLEENSSASLVPLHEPPHCGPFHSISSIMGTPLWGPS